MARWKARKDRVDVLLTVTEVLLLSLTVDELQGKTCQNSLLLEGVGHFEPRFQKGSSLWNILFWFLENWTHLARSKKRLSVFIRNVIPGLVMLVLNIVYVILLDF